MKLFGLPGGTTVVNQLTCPGFADLVARVQRCTVSLLRFMIVGRTVSPGNELRGTSYRTSLEKRHLRLESCPEPRIIDSIMLGVKWASRWTVECLDRIFFVLYVLCVAHDDKGLRSTSAEHIVL
jgi:hypothetical protein